MSSFDSSCAFSLFFFNDTATTEIYTLSLHDALPISRRHRLGSPVLRSFSLCRHALATTPAGPSQDRKSTRLNSSHVKISYAVFCLKKKNKKTKHTEPSHRPQRHAQLIAR